MSISLFFFYLQYKLNQVTNRLLSSLFNSANTDVNLPVNSLPINHTNSVPYARDIEFSSNQVDLGGAENLIRHAYLVSDLMLELNQSPVKVTSPIQLLQNENRTISTYLEIENSPIFTKRFNSFSLVSIESQFISSIDSSVSGAAYKLGLDGKLLSSMNNNTTISKLTNASIEQNLSIGKQTRWLTRSLPITECLSNSNFTYSQAKSLIGNPAFNSTLASKNI
jgi:hypothetical protein